MDFYAETIQHYLDAIADPECFCDGRLISFSPRRESEVITNAPNCEMRDQCPLFRNPGYGVRKMWRPVGIPKDGCDGFRFWESEKQEQEANAREWIVSMSGYEKVCNGRDPQAAAVQMWFHLIERGLSVDKMILFNREYSVRER
jgi:hypothetical protein